MRAPFAVVLALAACGDDTPGPTSKLLDFKPCLGNFQCATLTVPADWSAPDGDTISFPVTRAPARIPSQRIGALTFNFGGPGGSTADPIIRSYPNQPVASDTDLTNYFDFVLIDWRGVSTTTPILSCYTPDVRTRLVAQRFAPASDADWTALFQLTTDLAAGCTANPDNAPLLLHQDADSAARDLDALRAGLGEDQLNMWVVSYGTRLGAMYATLFPDRVRAIVLDSPVAPVPDLEEFLTKQSAAFEAEITRFFAWCASATNAQCPFRTSDGLASSVAARYEQLLATCNAAPPVAGGVMLDAATINLTTTTMMYTPAYSWPALGDALGKLAAGDGTRMADLFTQNQLGFAGDDNGFSTYQNVCAQDMPLPADIASPASFRTYATNVGTMSPHVGLQNSAAQAFAVAWPTTPPAEAVVGAPTAPPLLITATRHDPATPYEWAGAMQQALGNGSYLVTYEGDGHGNGSIETCLGNVSAQFLIDPTTPPAQTDCADNPPTLRIGKPAFRRSVRAW
jgi:pimeloyl-ACP methyl ester carboxylesterase